ncbi:MAG: cytochrome c family protein [Hyphomicrobium sp.]|uniref:c-type cytochrome n=1 Tax=Hyphomicrobium sp. TaxID=82 RepID=UPI0039E5FBA2
MRKWVLAIAMIAAVPAVGHAADAEAGKTIFNKCKACHQVDKNAVGPHLGGIVGRKAASVADYNYSDALKKSGITWDEAALDKWLQGPSKDVPGTKMIFAGVKDPTDRANLIAYLATLK